MFDGGAVGAMIFCASPDFGFTEEGISFFAEEARKTDHREARPIILNVMKLYS